MLSWVATAFTPSSPGNIWWIFSFSAATSGMTSTSKMAEIRLPSLQRVSVVTPEALPVT